MENEFIQLAVKSFGADRIICLLFYGSNAFDRSERKLSDYDFYLLLDKFEQDDYKKLKKISSIKKANIDLTFQYLDEIEARGWKNYQLGNHGLFYLLNFAQAKTLFGHNVFQRKLVGLNSELIIQSILFQIQEYFWRLDNWFLKEQDSKVLVDRFKKYLVRILTDILLLKEDISFSEINTFRYTEVARLIEYKDYFSNDTKRLIKEIFVDEKFEFTKLQSLQRYVYKDYLKLYSK